MSFLYNCKSRVTLTVDEYDLECLEKVDQATSPLLLDGRTFGSIHSALVNTQRNFDGVMFTKDAGTRKIELTPSLTDEQIDVLKRNAEQLREKLEGEAEKLKAKMRRLRETQNWDEFGRLERELGRLRYKIESLENVGDNLDPNSTAPKRLGYYTRDVYEDGSHVPGVVLEYHPYNTASLVSTYIHESFHAYVDHDWAQNNPDIAYAEEPIVEFGMLKTLEQMGDGFKYAFEYALDKAERNKFTPGLAHYAFAHYLYTKHADIDWVNLLRDVKYKIDPNSDLYQKLKGCLDRVYPFDNEEQAADCLYELLTTAQGKPQNLSQIGNSSKGLYDAIASVDECQRMIDMLKSLNAPIPPELLRRHDELAQRKPLINVYPQLMRTIGYTPELHTCIETTVQKLMENSNDVERPGLLLGKIQSGKTRGFVGVMARAFDLGFDICIVLTKGTNALVSQTVSRLKQDFEDFQESDILNQTVISVYDIMTKREGLSHQEADEQKNIIVCKKQKDNLNVLIDIFDNKCPELKDKKILVIDDEADFASRNYKKANGKTVLARLSEKIDDFLKLPKYCRCLLVTATPYSLYLQPDGSMEIGSHGKVIPFKPRFTSVLPIHSQYIGGDEYFEKSKNVDSMYHHLFSPVSEPCMEALGLEKDGRYLSNVEKSPTLYDLRKSLLGYFMASAIRSIQEEQRGKKYKSSCIVHVNIGTEYHRWDKELIDKLLKKWVEHCKKNDFDASFKSLFKTLYKDFEESNAKARKEQLISDIIPSENEVWDKVMDSLLNERFETRIVNSDNDVVALLNNDGQLRLSHDLNIFIGGQILDRGITIANLLCFLYGRNPQVAQQDTVLQHSRMYGNRSKEDMAVTRLCTTNRLHGILEKINSLDDSLRDLIIQFANDPNCDPSAAFVFVDADRQVRPCAPGKIAISDLQSIKPGKRFLPVGFQTGSATAISPIISALDQRIRALPGFDPQKFFEISVDEASAIAAEIRKTFIYDRPTDNNEGMEWNVGEFNGVMKYATKNSNGKLWCMYRENRNMSRIRMNGDFVDSPDDGRTDLAPSRAIATDRPVLMLIRQNGTKDQGWRNTPFYWPVLVCPKNVKPVIFTENQEK